MNSARLYSLLLAAIYFLTSCTIHDDWSKKAETAPNATAAAYVVASYNDNGTRKQEWQVASYRMGKFPPRISFTDPASRKQVTLTGSFTVEEIKR